MIQTKEQEIVFIAINSERKFILPLELKYNLYSESNVKVKFMFKCCKLIVVKCNEIEALFNKLEDGSHKSQEFLSLVWSVNVTHS